MKFVKKYPRAKVLYVTEDGVASWEVWLLLWRAGAERVGTYDNHQWAMTEAVEVVAKARYQSGRWLKGKP